MIDWILVTLVCTGAIALVAGIVLLLYIFAVSCKLSGFLSDLRGEGINKGFRKLIWG
jgi:hypothetical protein